MPWGQFGENLTTEGLDEKDTHIGDVLRVGAATVQVTQPRVPCFKLAAKFQREDILKRFMQSGRSGFYFSVIEEGQVAVGDEIERIQEDENGIAVSDINKLFNHGTDTALMRRVIGWRRCRSIGANILPHIWPSWNADRRRSQMSMQRKSILHQSFEVGISLKAVGALFEIVGGVLLWVVKPSQMNDIVRRVGR